MRDSVLIVVVFGGMTVAIWLSYKFFMRGFTAAERVAALLPVGFTPDWSYRLGDTYVGFERSNNRLVLVDWPHAKTVSPQDVEAIETEDERVAGITHRWIIVKVADAKTPRYRIWFRFSSRARDEWRVRLNELCQGNPSAVSR